MLIKYLPIFLSLYFWILQFSVKRNFDTKLTSQLQNINIFEDPNNNIEFKKEIARIALNFSVVYSVFSSLLTIIIGLILQLKIYSLNFNIKKNILIGFLLLYSYAIWKLGTLNLIIVDNTKIFFKRKKMKYETIYNYLIITGNIILFYFIQYN